tara:strand:- start:4119 stop:4742 length:624 start_codon:yes stop_codon:yes gene_type:complete
LDNALSWEGTTFDGLPKPNGDKESSLLPNLNWLFELLDLGTPKLTPPNPEVSPANTRIVSAFALVISSDHGEDAFAALRRRVNTESSEALVEEFERSKRTCVWPFLSLISFGVPLLTRLRVWLLLTPPERRNVLFDPLAPLETSSRRLKPFIFEKTWSIILNRLPAPATEVKPNESASSMVSLQREEKRVGGEQERVSKVRRSDASD